MAATGADTLVELGSGTSEKTRLLLDAMSGAGRLRRFVPFDVDEVTLRNAADAVAAEYEGVAVHAVVGDFEHHLWAAFPGAGSGSSPSSAARSATCARNRGRASWPRSLPACEPGDALLLGTDLVKDVDRLEAAYDDSEGVTAEFNRNILRVIDRRLGADFVPERFTHVARFDKVDEWIEMRLRSDVAQVVTVLALELTVDFDAGEEMRTEISAKFRRAGVEAELAAAGFELVHWWTDRRGDFALSLSFKD